MDECPKFEFQIPTIYGGEKIPNAPFTLNDETGFCKELQEKFGIQKEWIKLGERTVRINNGCQYAREDLLHCIAKCNNCFQTYPMPSNDKMKVFNPKEIIENSTGDSSDLLERIKIMILVSRYDEEQKQLVTLPC